MSSLKRTRQSGNLQSKFRVFCASGFILADRAVNETMPKQGVSNMKGTNLQYFIPVWLLMGKTISVLSMGGNINGVVSVTQNSKVCT